TLWLYDFLIPLSMHLWLSFLAVSSIWQERRSPADWSAASELPGKKLIVVSNEKGLLAAAATRGDAEVKLSGLHFCSMNPKESILPKDKMAFLGLLGKRRLRNRTAVDLCEEYVL
uniref:Uncharacterized protein n=1 Tax=Pelusios castaneus TaxID=367368 RepID=A0A8C8R997_9SAUR